LGHSVNLYYQKTSGVLRYNAEYLELSDDYNPNDLAYLGYANERVFSAGFSINRQTPYKNNLKSSYSLGASYARLYNPNAFTNLSIDLNSFVLKKYWFAYGFNASLKPTGEDDYFEPRVFDFISYYHRPSSVSFGGFISTDYSKAFAIDASANFTKFNQAGRYIANFSTSLRLLFNDHISVFPTINYTYRQDDEGRIYTSDASQGYDQLASTGYNTKGESLHNNSTGFFNIDANFVWRFVPGSTISIFYTQNNNNIKFGNARDGNYFNGIEYILASNRNINTGVKILYFLDYWNLRKALRQKKNKL
jgi:hypothetical protein